MVGDNFLDRSCSINRILRVMNNGSEGPCPNADHCIKNITPYCPQGTKFIGGHP